MRVNPLCIAVLAIAETAVILGAQELPANDAARQDHARVEREDIRYPKHSVHLKGRERYKNDLAKNIIYVPVSNKAKYYKSKGKSPSGADDSTNSVAQGNVKSKINWSEIVQEINNLSKANPNYNVRVEPGDKSPTAYVVTITNPQGGKRGEGGRDRVLHSERAECDCTNPPNQSGGEACGANTCANSLENTFQCTRCKTYFSVKLFLKESKCNGGAGGFSRAVTKNDTRLKRDKVNGTDAAKPTNVCNCTSETCLCKKSSDSRKTSETSKSSDTQENPCCPTPGCPSSLETMFRCPKCKAHYEVKMNFKESKCPACSAARSDTRASRAVHCTCQEGI